MNLNKIESKYKAASERSYSFGQGKRKYPFQLLGLRNLNPGRYKVRFLWPEPTKNPEGMLLIGTHKVIQNDKTEEKILMSECLARGESYPHITNTLEIIEQRGLFEKLKSMGEKTTDLRDAISSLVPWRRYWVPVYIYATEHPPSKPDGYPSYSPCYEEGVVPMDKILEMNESIKLVQAIFDACRLYPDLDDAKNGRYAYITVGKNSYKLEMDTRVTALPGSLVRFASENYPDLVKMMRKFYMKDPALVCSMCQSSWWAKSLETWWAKDQRNRGVTEDKLTVLFPDYSPEYIDDVVDENDEYDDEETEEDEAETEEEGNADDPWTDEELGEDATEVDDGGLPWDDEPEPPPTRSAPPARNAPPARRR